jgi:hypothetical protein
MKNNGIFNMSFSLSSVFIQRNACTERECVLGREDE